MVVDIKSKMSLSVLGLDHLSSKEGKTSILIEDIGIKMLMIHVQEVEKDKLRDRKKFRNKKAKMSRNESEQQKINANCS